MEQSNNEVIKPGFKAQAELVRLGRIKLGWSQKRLAIELGISRQQMNSIERARSGVPYHRLRQFKEIFGQEEIVRAILSDIDLQLRTIINRTLIF